MRRGIGGDHLMQPQAAAAADRHQEKCGKWEGVGGTAGRLGGGFDRQHLLGSAGRGGRKACAVGMGKRKGRAARERQQEKSGLRSYRC